MAEQSCGGSCVDQNSDALHCGGCEKACARGQKCEAGECLCPAGQTLCGDACVDMQASDDHCGACDQACSETQACMAGICRSPAGADGCAHRAGGVTLSSINLYQGVRIAVMENGSEVTPESRNADVVAGRQALFRINLELDSGFSARELSARTTVYNDGGTDTYFFKQRVSLDDDASRGFDVRVPADRIQPDTSYSVEVVECETPAGSLRSPSFPEVGQADVGAREVGVLKVVLVPARANGRVPDLSEPVLQRMRDYMLAMYPIGDIELTVTSEISLGYPIDWSWFLDQIRQKRQSEHPDAGVYYYGVAQPVGSFNDFCRGGCTTGLGNVVTDARDSSARVSVGAFFGGEVALSTMAHELGHNHGRFHAPCGGAAGPDGRFPYPGGGIGVWGYDFGSDRYVEPGVGKDIMGYCEPNWISDYTYQALLERVTTLNDPGFSWLDPRPVSRWHAILIDRRGVRWGHPFEQADKPFGEQEWVEMLDVDGQVVEQAAAYRTEFADGDGGGTLLVPEPAPGWHAVRFRGMHVPVELAFPEP